MTDFADTLRAERERAGLTQAQLADAADVSRSYIALMESEHKGAPPDPQLIALATALGCDPDLLFAAANRTPPDITASIDQRMRAIKDLRAQVAHV